VTLILPAAQLGRALAAIAAAGLGAARVLPLWPRAGRPARLMLLQARKGAAGGEQILPGLVLHDEAGRFTDAAEAVLRHGAGLVLG
jgi:tRNA1(Val) A37 N6-methylase TrmN6